MPTRRSFLSQIGIAGAGLAAGTSLPSRKASADQPKPPEEVAPAEDLMREHGVLNRILLIYEEGAARLEGGRSLPSDVLPASAGIIQGFIEAYHEKLEEDHLFPRFEKAGRETDLVRTLRQQHEAGRRVTSEVLSLAKDAAALSAPAGRRKLAGELRAFIRMYRPHEAREDTVLFPAFRELVSASEYEKLGDLFEDREHELFGEKGFETMVDRVAGLEKKLGIYELSRFTPR